MLRVSKPSARKLLTCLEVSKMTKRTVDVCLSVRGSAVVDIDVLLENLRKSDKHPWAKHLLAIYEDGGADALAQVYVKQAYVGGLDNLLRDWSLSAVTVEEHGGKAKFAPSRCTASVRPKKIRHLYPADVAVGGRYKFLNPRAGLYQGVFVRTGDSHSQCADESYSFEWGGHETHPIELVV